MRRKELLDVVDLTEANFKTMSARHDLPVRDLEEVPSTGWADFSVRDAIAMQVMLDGIQHHTPTRDDARREPSKFHGLRPETAASVASNGLRRLGLGESDDEVLRVFFSGGPDRYIAWAAEPDGLNCHASAFGAGTLVEILTWIQSNDARFSRIVLINATRAAHAVVNRGVSLWIRDFKPFAGFSAK